MRKAILLVVLSIIIGAAMLPAASAQDICEGVAVTVVLPKDLPEGANVLVSEPTADAVQLSGEEYKVKDGQLWTVVDVTADGSMAQVCNPNDPSVKGWTLALFVTVVAQPALEATVEAVAPVAVDASVVATPPTDLALLPHGMTTGMAYQDPRDNCRDVVVVGETCSTYERQSVEGQFTLDPREALVVTGDVVNIRWTVPAGYAGPMFKDENGNTVVYPRIEELSGSKADIVVIANNSDAPLTLYLDAPNGSFRGFFTLGFIYDVWEGSLLANLRDLHITYMMLQSEPAIEAWTRALVDDQDTPYPQLNPANCSAVADLEEGEVTFCDITNNYISSWNGTTWDLSVNAYGIRRDSMTGMVLPVDVSTLVGS